MLEELRRYLEETFLFQFGGDIDDDSNLFRLGIIDSFGYVQMLRELESRYAITFGDEELLHNVPVSLSRLVSTVSSKVAAAGERCAG